MRLEEYKRRAARQGLTSPLHQLHFPLMRECIANGHEWLAGLLVDAIMITVETDNEEEELVISYTDKDVDAAAALTAPDTLMSLQHSLVTLLDRNLNVRVLI